MSRFSKKEAKQRGWQFVHETEEQRVPTNDAGEYRVIPASIRAEKHLPDGTLINEEAETTGLLLERIAWQEARLDSLNIEHVPVVIPEDVVREEADPENEQRTVIAPDGSYISEESLASRSRGDAVLELDGDGEPVFRLYGPTEAAGEIELDRDELATEAENERTAETDYGPTEQLDIDNSQTVVDLPGGATGSVLVVQEGETPEDLVARREEQSVAQETARVQADLAEVKGYSEAVPEPTLEAHREARAEAEEKTAKKLTLAADEKVDDPSAESDSSAKS